MAQHGAKLVLGARRQDRIQALAKELTGSPSDIAPLTRGPKNQIDTRKIRALGMTFGGEELLRVTVQQLVEAHRAAG